MRTLLVSPSHPNTFFSYGHALRFARKKAALPPLGLMTVAAMLPSAWPKKLVDLNVEPLTRAHLAWADAVLISAMIIHKKSALDVIAKCHEAGIKVVVGGPLFSIITHDIEGVDHYLIGEAEDVLPTFLEELAAGTAKRLYSSTRRPDLAASPTPAWQLLKARHYHSLSIQVSRGCPYDCEFCDIVRLFGRRVRFKSTTQIVTELDAIHQLGWRGDVMFVDDNFIGHKRKARELLRTIAAWQQSHGYPFVFNTQASINLSQEPELMNLMNEANLNCVFLGIETPAAESLQECNKKQNQDLDLVKAVKTIQSHGITVSGGFIIGFDSDPETIFDDQVSFIEKASIPTAMVGLLSVGPGTRLHERLSAERRVLRPPTGNNTADLGALNFIPKMNKQKLLAGYRSVLSRLYEPKAFYARVLSFLAECGPSRVKRRLPSFTKVMRNLAAAARIFWRLGFVERGRRAFWAYLVKVALKYPSAFVTAMNFAAVGFHFKKITAEFVDTTGAKRGQPRALPA